MDHVWVWVIFIIMHSIPWPIAYFLIRRIPEGL